MVQSFLIYLLVVKICFMNIKLWLPVKLESPFCQYLLTINDLYNGANILNLPLAVVEIWFLFISNFDFRFGQEVKVK